jgi:acetoin utilization protein AcuB
MTTPTKPLTVASCMSIDPVTVAPSDSLQRVVELLRRRDIRAVPVVDGGKLVGIVTDRDVRQVRDEVEIRHYTENLTVTAAMTADPMTVTPTTSLIDAAKILETYRISSLPVVDDDRVVGILTVTDLLRVFVAQNTGMAA